MRKLTTGQKVMIAVVFLVILTAVMLFLSTGGEDTKAHAATVQAAGFRVTSARFTLDHDITTGGRILGFDGVSIEEPTIGYYNYAGHKNGGYLIYARFTFTQCIPVIQIGPLCNDRRAWLKELVHYDGSGYASGNAP
jgi:hypothetical protein